MIGVSYIGQVYIAGYPQYTTVAPPIPPAPPPQTSGGGGAWTSEYRYRPLNDDIIIRIVDAQVWDRSKTLGVAMAEVERVVKVKPINVVEAGVRSAIRSRSNVMGVIERLGATRSKCVSRASVVGYVIVAGSFKSIAHTRGSSISVVERYANAHSLSATASTANLTAERLAVAGSFASTKQSVDSDVETVFTEEQMQAIAAIMSETFYKDE